jgi:hypothetical protein
MRVFGTAIKGKTIAGDRVNVMLPQGLKPESFRGYPPLARSLMVRYLGTLQELPLVLLPNLLREAIVYDWRFPMEREELDGQLAYLGGLTKQQLDHFLADFSKISLAGDFEKLDWVNDPNVFVQQLTAYLWASHQMDAFHHAADAYGRAWQEGKPVLSPGLARLGIVVIGQGVSNSDYPLFRKLRPYGVYFTHVSAQGGLQVLLDEVSKRASTHPANYSHWYIDGGTAEANRPGVTAISYDTLGSIRQALLERMQNVIQSGSSGPEALRTMLSQMKPQDLGMPAEGDAGVLNYFQMTLLTEGSGTQIFSTTFAQWAAREALRRAQPNTLLVRFAPRQRQQPMNELISGVPHAAELDPEGSLVDADMGAYYNWLNQQRLPGAEKASFLVWFEGHDQALAIAPALPHGTISSNPTDLKHILEWMS